MWFYYYYYYYYYYYLLILLLYSSFTTTTTHYYFQLLSLLFFLMLYWNINKYWVLLLIQVQCIPDLLVWHNTTHGSPEKNTSRSLSGSALLRSCTGSGLKRTYTRLPSPPISMMATKQRTISEICWLWLFRRIFKPFPGFSGRGFPPNFIPNQVF